jgi:choline dehydrogenase-like flavoprotein
MFIDARSITDGETIDCDLCVIGAGAAGITLARAFAGRSKRVCVIESGDQEYDPETQALYQGESVGLPYVPLDSCRLRFFGGTTNHWGGQCLPLTEAEFEKRPWLPYTGWPIKRSALAPYYERARAMLTLPDQGWDVAAWEKEFGTTRLAFDPARFVTTLYLKYPVHFAEVYRQELADSDNVRMYLNANATEIATNEDASLAASVIVRTLSGSGFSIRAKRFVLAAGGIENPRLLLLSNSVQKAGLGNQHDLVGRFFLEHPHFQVGVIQPTAPDIPVWFYDPTKVPGVKPPRYMDVRPFLMITDEVLQSEQLTPVEVDLRPIRDASYESAGYRSLSSVYRELRSGEMPDDLAEDIQIVLSDIGDLAGLAYRRVRYGQVPVGYVDCRVGLSPVPNPDSRVMLGDERDALGLRRVKLDWRLSEIDKRSARRAVEMLGIEVGRLGLGRLRSTLDDDDTTWPEDLDIANHHIGTTRMADDPRYGVVDGNCKVHGMANLYVAGSSVFPTAGVGTPTLLIVALAMRLADHIADLA